MRAGTDGHWKPKKGGHTHLCVLETCWYIIVGLWLSSVAGESEAAVSHERVQPIPNSEEGISLCWSTRQTFLTVKCSRSGMQDAHVFLSKILAATWQQWHGVTEPMDRPGRELHSQQGCRLENLREAGEKQSRDPKGLRSKMYEIQKWWWVAHAHKSNSV